MYRYGVVWFLVAVTLTFSSTAVGQEQGPAGEPEQDSSAAEPIPGETGLPAEGPGVGESAPSPAPEEGAPEVVESSAPAGDGASTVREPPSSDEPAPESSGVPAEVVPTAEASAAVATEMPAAPPLSEPSDSSQAGAASDDEEEPLLPGETEPLFSLGRDDLSLAFLGSIQLLAVPYIQNPMASLESGSIANAEGFRLRRARFGISGELPLSFGYQLLFEHGADGAELLDAHLSYSPWSWLQVTAGALKVPFSGVMVKSREYQAFLQRPYIVSTVAPDRALGVELSGRLPWLSYYAGLFNGGGDYYRGDNNAGMLYAGRLVIHPLGALPEGEITLPDRFLFHAASSYFFNQDATGNRHALTGELALAWWRFSLQGEVLWSTFDPAGEPETNEAPEYGQTTRFGWFAQLGAMVVREHLQVAFRAESQQINEAVDYRDLNDLWAVSAAVNGYLLQGRLKLTLLYQHRHEWFGEQVNNDYLALQLQGRI